MDLKTNWNVFSKNRDAIYGVAIISIIIFHFFEDVASSNISEGGRFAGEIYNTFVGSVGVEFFIFLSGVGLYFSMTKDSRVRYFFQKRLKRILPTYLTVAVPYWIAVDIVCKQRGWTVFAADISFVTIFAHGTRTFWYVLFIGLAYLTYPAVYKVLHTKHTEYFQLVVLIMTALLIQLLPKIILPELYSNIEIMLGRFLIFFIGCWCGKKVYQNELINNKEKIGIFFGAGLMLGDCLPITRRVVNKLGYRILMCFWGIFLLYCLAANLKKIPQRIRWILQRFGNASYELYLTHVAIRAFMNLIGMRTYYLQNYILCVLVSLLLTSIIIKLQRMMIRAT